MKGWKMVPTNPTSEMIGNASKTLSDSPEVIYATMLSAAPEPPKESVEPVAWMLVNTKGEVVYPWIAQPSESAIEGTLKANAGYSIVPVYTHPPTLRLPERKTGSAPGSDEHYWDGGYNQAIDDVRKLWEEKT